MAMFPTGVENHLLKAVRGVGVPHFFISGNHQVLAANTLDDSGVQTRPRIAHFGFGEALLHKSGESKTGYFNFAVFLQLDHSTPRCMSQVEQLLPRLECTVAADGFRSILGWMQAQAFREVGRSCFPPGEKGIHHRTSKSILKGHCSLNVCCLASSSLRRVPERVAIQWWRCCRSGPAGKYQKIHPRN